MPKLSTLTDSFTAGAINTALWSTITVGAATLDTVNDQVMLAVPTTSGGISTFGTTAVYDATGSSVYAQVGVAANGNGGTKSIMRVRLDANNAMTLRVESGVFKQVQVSGGATTTVTLPAYDPHAHRWWRLREAASTWYADTSPDGLNWTNLSTMAYTWDATQVTLRFESQASVTEVAGNTTVIAHVNTRSGGQYNPNWPRAEYGAGLWWGANGGSIPRGVYVDVSQRTQGTTTVGRGRQYELDQVRAGEEQVTLGNPDGYLDPTSTTSPVAGHVQPFQPFRIRGQWPPTVNLLSRGVAAGGDATGVSVGTITPSITLDLHTDTDITGGSVVASASAWAGGRVTQFTVPIGTVVGQRIAHSPQVAVLPGQPYTAQIHVRDVTASTTLQVKPALGWYDASSPMPTSYIYGSTVTLTGSTTAGWSTLTVSGTAPAGVYGIDVGVAVAGTAAANCLIQTDGWQQETGMTASAWVMPGAWYPWYAGFTEDWQSQWSMSGTYGTVSPPAADAFSLLSQLTLSSPLTMELNSRSPRYLYTLGDPDGSTAFTDTTGAFPALPIAVSKQGAGTLTAGTAITAASPTGVYTGSAGTVVTLTTPSPGVNAPAAAASFLDLGGAGILGPSSNTFTRMIAFRYTGPAPTAEADLWTAMDQHGGANPGGQLRLWIDTAGHVNLQMASVLNGGINLSLTTAVADSNWHLVLFGQDAIGGTHSRLFLSVDGTYTDVDSSTSGGHDTPYFPQGIVSDAVGAAVRSDLGNATNYTFKGDLSYVAELATGLTSTDCTGVYTAWRSAAAGESTDARYARILRYAGYTGPTSLQAGLTTSMGPAATDGQDVVSALQDVVTTENGAHFVAADGTITFRSRSARYNALTPAYVFGERADLGELPYEDVKTVWDSTHLGNQVAVTQASTGQVFNARDAASIAAYFPRTLTRTVNASSALECQDAADYALSRYKAPLNRITALQLHPSANPALWPVCLGLELGTRVRVMRRPPGLTATQLDVFVENISWSFDDKNEAVLTLQCSPADITPYKIFAAFHTTLNATVASGVGSVVIDHGQDNTNLAAQQLWPGQQLVLGQNTANAETVTILAVGATSPGWSTATVTLTAPTSKAHTAGDVICEPLPAVITDPTTWDAVSAFDAAAFAY